MGVPTTSAELTAAIAAASAKVLDGSITDEELGEALRRLREDRYSINAKPAKKPAAKKAKKKTETSDDQATSA